jgi:DnaJ-domain-containing protein 1
MASDSSRKITVCLIGPACSGRISRQDRDNGFKEDASRPWWEVLNVDRNASVDQIKEAFRREISKYHPDRVEGLGVELRAYD